MAINSSIIFSANEVKIKQKYEDAEYLYLNNDYSNALENYLSILEIDSVNFNVHYKVALCYLQLNKEDKLLEATSHLKIAIKGVSKKYKNHYTEKNSPTLAWLYYGDVLRLNYKFNEASKAYNKYIELEPNNKQTKEYVIRELRNCKSAPTLLENKIYLTEVDYNYEIKKKDEFESCPVISANEDILVFAYGKENLLPPDILSISNVDDYKTDDIYYSIKTNEKWTNPINITTDLGINNQALITSISTQGDVLYLVQDDNDDGNIYQSNFVNGKWTVIKKLGKNINSSRWETYASISGDNKTLFFASDRKGGYGGFDIYKSELDENGKWGKAKNLGRKINTEFDEDTPNITRNGKRLYFSSQGHDNLGGYDIFYSDLTDSSFTAAKNAGYPLNTPGNDLFVLTQYNSQIAFAPLNDDKLRGIYENNSSQVFFVSEEEKMFNIKIIVSVKNQNDSLLKNINTDTSNTNISDFLITDNIITFKTTNKSLNLPINADNTDTTILNITFNENDKADITKEYNVDLTLTPVLALVETPDNINQNNNVEVNAETPITNDISEIKTIYFNFDKSFIQEEFNAQVKEIYTAWLKDKSKTILIEGYADPVGPEAYNLKLSQRRADAVKKYLLKLGVDSSKIESVGKGETAENTDDYYNRKTVISLK